VANPEWTDPIEWSGSPDPLSPDNFWIDDDTGERVCADNGDRSPANAIFYQQVRLDRSRIGHEAQDAHGNTIAAFENEAQARAFIESALA
jgi:hypothetical protein